MNFRETGNKVPVTVDELINFSERQLGEFDALVSQSKSIPSQNPYTDPIIYTTQEGKTIKVPQEIQKEAVNNWYNKTGRNVPVMQQSNQEVVQEEMRPKQLPQKKVVYVQENGNDLVKLGILIFAAMLALYLFIKMGKESAPFGVTDEQLRYYLTK